MYNDTDNIELVKATEEDAQELLKIQRMSYELMYRKYNDYSSPYRHTVVKMISRIYLPYSDYYKIVLDNKTVGGIWIIKKKHWLYWIGALYITPQLQCKGIGGKAIAMAEHLYPLIKEWGLDCPVDMEVNKACYVKSGYRDNGERQIVNERLTLAVYVKHMR